MTIGLPKGLMYPKYHVFARTFFEELGVNTVTSPDTNKEILKNGVQTCVDEACLPIKVFHGHTEWLARRCDMMLVPRFMALQKRQLVCPMFCGLIEMVKSSARYLPPLIDTPVYSLEPQSLEKWATDAGSYVTGSKRRISMALERALEKQREHKDGYFQNGYEYLVALIGHSYIIHDHFVNMNLIHKLNALGIGVMTADYVSKKCIDREAGKLFKQPFWYFMRQYYGAAMHLYQKRRIDGIIYVSAFSCGVDSVVSELIKSATQDYPLMVLKIDEHTGEAGFDTRIEAYSDMLGRRLPVGHHISAYGEYLSGSESFL